VISSKLLRLILDDARDEAKLTNGSTLRAQLRVYETGARQVLAGGSIASTSTVGRHVAYSRGERSSVTLVDIAEGYRRLIDVHDQSVVDLGVAIDGTKDDAIKNQMMTYLREITGYTSNWQYLSK
jgi:hypothetical protein